MKDMYGPYFILLIHIITLTFRIYLKHIVDNTPDYIIPIDNINIWLNNLLKTDKIFDNGKIDMITLTNLIFFSILGYNFTGNIIITILSTTIIEGCIIYYNDNGQLILNIIASIIGYLIGLFFNNRKKYNNHKNRYNNMNSLLQYDFY
jgi:hypothetical protein